MKIIKICLTCKKEFSVLYLSWDRTYCSQKCYWQSLIGKPTKIKGRKRIFSEEHKENLSKALMGNKNSLDYKNFLGFKHSKEAKEKISVAHKGKKLSEEHKRKIGEGGKCRKHSKETIEKLKLRAGRPKGFHHTKEWIKKFSKQMKGEKNPAWKGGITPEYLILRNSKKSQEWKITIFKRDNYTCQICGDNKGGNLNAHHIKSFKEYSELRFEISNGLTLCEDCHINIHSKNFVHLDMRPNLMVFKY